MGFGAFAGGVVKGYQAVNDVINTNKRTQIAEQDQALRKRASDREETRYQRELSEQAKKDELERQYAENIKLVFGTPETPQSTGTMTGPLDSKDARAGTMDGVKTEYNIPAQAATGDGGMGGVNLLDPSNHGKLLKLEAMNMAARIKAGMYKPEEVRQYAEWGKKMEKDGSAQAFGRFILGDKTALDDIAKKNGVKAYSTEFGKDEDGAPALMFKIEREDGQIVSLPASIVAAGLGATDFVSTLDKMEDNATNRYKAKAQAEYYGTQGQAALERNDILAEGQDERIGIERQKANAYVQERQSAAGRNQALARKADRYVPGGANAKGETGPTYDNSVIRKALKDIPFQLPQIGKKTLTDDGKPKVDNDAMQRGNVIGTHLLSIGEDPARAEAITRSTVAKANEAARKEVGPNGTQEQWLAARNRMLDTALESVRKQKPKAAPAKPESDTMKVPPSTQKARDTDRVSLLREEQQKEAAKLAELKSKPQNTKEYADAVARVEKNIEALNNELGNAAKQVSAFRTR